MRIPRPARALVVLVLTASAVGSCTGGGAAPDHTAPAAQETAAPSAGTGVRADAELPESFPADAVPLVGGAIASSVSTVTEAGIAWIVSVRADGLPEEAKGVARQLLLDAGFIEPEELVGLGMSVLEKEGYQVLLAASEQNGATVVNYTVTRT